MERNKKIVLGVIFLLIIVGMIVAAVVGYPLFYGTGSGVALPGSKNNVSPPTQNPNSSSVDSAIVFSGARVAAPNVIDIYTYSPDGKIQDLTSSPFSGFKGGLYATFSPDQKKIAYVTYRDMDAVVAIMDSDGNNKKIISKASGIKYFPSWSPDGHTILYKNGVWGDINSIDPKAAQGHIDLVQVDLASGGEKNLTVPYQTINNSAWLPDGQGYSFVTTQVDLAQNKELNKFIVFKNGAYSEIKPSAGIVLADAIANPEFSSDMKQIAFINSQDNQVYLMNADGTGVKELTSGSTGLIYSCPSWSHDNGFLLVAVNDTVHRKSSIVKILVSNGASYKIDLNDFVSVDCPRIGRH